MERWAIVFRGVAYSQTLVSEVGRAEAGEERRRRSELKLGQNRLMESYCVPLTVGCLASRDILRLASAPVLAL